MMALTISESRYQEIRRRINEVNLQKSVTEAMAAPDERTFGSVGELFRHLDGVIERSEDRLPELDKKEC
jgi:hypothetical protein